MDFMLYKTVDIGSSRYASFSIKHGSLIKIEKRDRLCASRCFSALLHPAETNVSFTGSYVQHLKTLTEDSKNFNKRLYFKDFLRIEKKLSKQVFELFEKQLYPINFCISNQTQKRKLCFRQKNCKFIT